ncbi:hypothetical protein P7K49_020336 [Saguinus oedipus]|uniref:Uncharacterized protein n=1 Tax=Saguinus oedipus TaxID=9490 RepID=A0ABQ9V0W8_SAGOE|nr:hypothetical protein P7K49_020336 [Saguinus oedipus]
MANHNSLLPLSATLFSPSLPRLAVCLRNKTPGSAFSCPPDSPPPPPMPFSLPACAFHAGPTVPAREGRDTGWHSVKELIEK